MSKIDDVLRIFEDGRVHEVDEITKKVSLPKFKVQRVIDFLAEFNLVEFNGRRGRARASPMGMRILSREEFSKFPVFF